MSNEKQFPSSPPLDLIYECSTKSFYNTTITSPGGRTWYIIETLVMPPRQRLCIVTRDEERKSSTQQEVATITWRGCRPDLVTFANQEPIRVKDLFPKRWYTFLWAGRLTNDPASGRRWRGECHPRLVDRDGNVLVTYQRKLCHRDAATIRVTPSAATNMNEVILGLIVLHDDAVRRWRLRAVLLACCLHSCLHVTCF